MALRCDLIIRDATVFDGTGGPRFRADVGVSGDRIVAVGDLGGASAEREVLAEGKAVAPGFIDAHTHDDRAVLCGPACMLCKMSQGRDHRRGRKLRHFPVPGADADPSGVSD